MPIVMKHGTNPASVIQAKFAGGRGEQLGKMKLKGLDNLGRLDRQRIHEESRADIADQVGENRLNRLKTKNAFEYDEASRKRLGDREDTLFESGLDRGTFEFELTAQQKADDEKYKNDMYELQNNPDFDEDQKDQGLRLLAQKRAGIKGIEELPEKSKYLEGQGEGEVWFDEAKGQKFTRDLTGQVKSETWEKPGTLGSSDKIKLWDSSREAATDLTTGVMDIKNAEKIFKQGLKVISLGEAPEAEGKDTPRTIQDIVDKAEGLGADRRGEIAAADPVKEVEGIAAPEVVASNPEAKAAWNERVTAVEDARRKVTAIKIGTENGQLESLDAIGTEIAQAKEALAAEVKTHGKQGYKRKKGEKRTKPTYYTDDTRDARQVKAKKEIKALEERRDFMKDMEDKLKLKAMAEEKKLQILKDSMKVAK